MDDDEEEEKEKERMEGNARACAHSAHVAAITRSILVLTTSHVQLQSTPHDGAFDEARHSAPSNRRLDSAPGT